MAGHCMSHVMAANLQGRLAMHPIFLEVHNLLCDSPSCCTLEHPHRSAALAGVQEQLGDSSWQLATHVGMHDFLVL